jgi:hypothetical protein
MKIERKDKKNSSNLKGLINSHNKQPFIFKETGKIERIKNPRNFLGNINGTQKCFP